MSTDTWTSVDRYLGESLLAPDPALEAALRDSAAAGLAAINVTPPQGKFLHLLARIHGARRMLEIGTLGGYSTIWLARALPAGGRLITLEIDPKCAAVAQANLERAGVSDRVEIRLAPAIESLPRLQAEGAGPFDLVFIDADKASTDAYFDWALRLSRPGTVVVVDNVVRNGGVIDAASADPGILGVRRFLARLAQEKHVDASALQTVGAKGYDGFALAVVK